MTNEEELRKLYDAEPFTPFEIILDDGRKVRVEERLNFGWAAKTQTLMFGVGKVVDWVKFDRVKQLRPLSRPESTAALQGANMVSESVIEALRRYRSKEPFEPYELVFKDGRRVPITTPEAVGWHAGRDKLSYAADDDSFEHAALSELAEVHLIKRTDDKGVGA